MKNSSFKLVLRVSKVRSASVGNYYSFKIDTNISTIGVHSVGTTLEVTPGLLESSDRFGLLKELKDQMIGTLETVFSLVKIHLEDPSCIGYKCIFSDKFVAGGYAVSSNKPRTEFIKELVVPMNEAECSFVFSCIPVSFC